MQIPQIGTLWKGHKGYVRKVVQLVQTGNSLRSNPSGWRVCWTWMNLKTRQPEEVRKWCSLQNWNYWQSGTSAKLIVIEDLVKNRWKK